MIRSAYAQNSIRTEALAPAPEFIMVADQVANAPLVIRARINTVKLLKNDTANVPPAGFRRVLVEATVNALIRGEGGAAPRISYLADVATDGRGKMPKLKKQYVLLFARPTARGDYIQLLSRNSQMRVTPERESIARALAEELVRPDAAPAIIGVGDAFHIAGTVAGEGETQIFLKTASGAPVSLSIIRRPDQTPRWGVALGEVVDETAVPPQRNTLLWYRLACGLPAALPAQSKRTLPIVDAEAAERDYQFVREALGTCQRTL